MRLTCPNCGATYAVPDEDMPAGGGHVQCSACHTRWFARAARPAQLSEEQIIARLEGREAGPRLVDAPHSGPRLVDAPHSGPREATAAPAPIAFPAPERATASAPAEPTRAPAAETTGVVTPLRPRQAAERTAVAAPAPVVAPSGGGRFAAGLVLGLAVTGAALAAYARADDLAARAPAAAPALTAYVDRVDAVRSWIEERVGPVRDRLLGG